MTKNDETLQLNVQNSIKWEPLLKDELIQVSVENSIVTLSGTVNSYVKKMEAEYASKSVSGVKCLIQNILVQLQESELKDDASLSDEIKTALQLDRALTIKDLKVTVKNGGVLLEGELPWNYQKISAQNTVSLIVGVKDVTNKLKIKTKTQYTITKKEIEDALIRNWTVGEEDIEVMVSGHKVRLIGTVQSLYQKEEASRIAWKAPGVTAVDNYLYVYFG